MTHQQSEDIGALKALAELGEKRMNRLEEKIDGIPNMIDAKTKPIADTVANIDKRLEGAISRLAVIGGFATILVTAAVQAIFKFLKY